MNKFLASLEITFRRDPTNYRPRVNKLNSVKDKEQKCELLPPPPVWNALSAYVTYHTQLLGTTSFLSPELSSLRNRFRNKIMQHDITATHIVPEATLEFDT